MITLLIVLAILFFLFLIVYSIIIAIDAYLESSSKDEDYDSY